MMEPIEQTDQPQTNFKDVVAWYSRGGKARGAYKQLPKVLSPGERVLIGGAGTLGTRHGLLVVTTERVFFLTRSLFSVGIESVDRRAVTSVTAHTGLKGSGITITSATNVLAVTNMNPSDVTKAERALRAAVIL